MSLLNDVDHRDFPVPTNSWIMSQTWNSLLFAHYPVPQALLSKLIPACFDLDTYENEAWISIVPFQMSGIKVRGLPKIPFTPEFTELNVRTYVTYKGKPGVYFFSLDANSKLSVFLANKTYQLPYYHAKMDFQIQDKTISIISKRTDSRVAQGEFACTYQPIGDVFLAKRGSLDHWVTERYLLYVLKGTKIYEGNIHHPSWPLQQAKARITLNTVADSVGIPITEPAPLLHYAKKLEVVVWPPKKIGSI